MRSSLSSSSSSRGGVVVSSATTYGLMRMWRCCWWSYSYWMMMMLTMLMMMMMILFCDDAGVAEAFSVTPSTQFRSSCLWGSSASASASAASSSAASSAASSSSSCPRTTSSRTSTTGRRSLMGPLFASSSSSSAAAALTPIPNEFSRPLNTDRILKTSSGKQRHRSYQRNYETTIEASMEECSALAHRFGLKRLESLKADLSLSLPPHYGSQGGGGSSSYLTVQVEGSILASLTQTCVRTNEDFEVTVEFPVTAIVKPVSMNNFQFQANGDDDDDLDEGPSTKKKKKASSTKSSNNKKSFRTDRLYNLNDMSDLQSLINQQENELDFLGGSGSGGFDDDDVVVEDESIYSLATGNLDVGELVAQTFWLNLDPYPKKPGSGPVQFEISG